MSNYIASIVDPLLQQARRFTDNAGDPETECASGTGQGELRDSNVEDTPSPADSLGPQPGPSNETLAPQRPGMPSRRSLSASNISTEPSLESSSGSSATPRGLSSPFGSTADLSRLLRPGRSSQDAQNDSTSLQLIRQPAADTTQASGLPLPEDDGMRTLRQKIHAIRASHISPAEKARLIHNLMTEDYRALKSPRPPRSELSRPQTPTFSQNKRDSLSGLSGPYYLTPDDLTPTYVPKCPKASKHSDNEVPTLEDLDLDDQSDGEDDEADVHLGCEHYRRNVKLQCFTCKRWYTCRLCHDSVEDHTLERRKTEFMLCMLCQSPQPASQRCKSCSTIAACYYCSICKLWDNDGEKAIYHCNDCGICRRGQGLGKDYFHCKTCAVCLPISIETTHRCIESSTKCDCPICGDYMFSSPESVILMRCGHSMHHRCYSDYTKTSYRCPICAKTIRNMESDFRGLDRMIEAQPMPAEYQGISALVHCNDCRAKSLVRFHWLGLKCEACESYNTNQLELQYPPGSNNNNAQIADVTRHQLHPLLQSNQPNSPVTTQASGHSILAETSGQPHLSPVSIGRRDILASSPRVTNYFGIDPRETPGPEGTSHNDSWGGRLLSIIGSGESDSDSEEEDDEDGDDDENMEPADDEDDEEDEGDVMAIFGHR